MAVLSKEGKRSDVDTWNKKTEPVKNKGNWKMIAGCCVRGNELCCRKIGSNGVEMREGRVGEVRN